LSQPLGRVRDIFAEPSSASRPCVVGSVYARRKKVKTEKDHKDEEPKTSIASIRPAVRNKGGLSGHWSVSFKGNWRLTFAFENGDAILVDYQDCH
jgi:hypothetical protein